MGDYVVMQTSGIVRDTVNARYIKCSKQQSCRMLLEDTNDEHEYYLKNNFIPDKFIKDNIGIVKDNEIHIDHCVLKRDPVNTNLFISTKDKVAYNISTMEYIPIESVIQKSFDLQQFCQAQLGINSDQEVYPKSKRVKHLLAKSNLAIVKNDEIDIDSIVFKRINKDSNIFMASTMKMFDISTFQFIEPKEIIPQKLAQILKQSDKTFYPKSLKIANIYRSNNLEEVTSNVINVNKVDFMQLPNNKDLYVSNALKLFNIQTFEITDYNPNDDEISPQKLAQTLKQSDKTFYPKSLTVMNIYKDTNLEEVTSNVININKDDFTQLPNNKDLYVSGKLKLFNIQSFEITNYNPNNDEMTAQELAQLILQTNNEVYPAIITSESIFKKSNLREVDNNSIHINNLIYTRHPHLSNIFVSHKFTAFDITTFKPTMFDASELTNQELAHFIVITEHKLYPRNIEGVTNILTSENLVTLRDDEFEVMIDDDKLYRNELDPNKFQSKSGFIKFNLETFELKKEISEEYSIQQHARDILNTDKWVYPSSTNRLNMLTKGNLNIIEEETLTSPVRINNVQMRQHPAFHNILGSKNLKIFDMETFKFITDPAIEYCLPFNNINFGTIVIDEEHVFNRDSMTINNHEINWSNILEGKTISELRYIHPRHDNYCVNFYGRPFKIDINVDTEIITYKPVRILYNGYIKISYQGFTLIMTAERFAYECFNSEITENAITILNNKLAYEEFKYCKWNLKKSDKKARTNISSIMVHPNPKYNKYAYDADNNKVYSFFGDCGGQYIKMFRNFIRISDRTLPFRNQRTYPLVKFIYECTTQKIVDEDDFIINENVIKFGTPSFEMDGETYTISDKDKHFYRNTDKTKYFYTNYNDLVQCVDGQLILKKTGPVTKDITDLWKD